MVFDAGCQVLGTGRTNLKPHYPQPGWVEHDPEELWQGQMDAAQAALADAGLHGRDLAAIGITNQRETCLLWDAETGRTLGNAVVWQCRRTADRCEELKQEGWEPLIQRKTGLLLDPYFSATKLEWLLAAHPEAQELLHAGRLRAGTIDSFLIWRLTGGKAHVTDYSNASRTMLLNIHSLQWDDELLALFGLPPSMLPGLRPSAGLFGLCDPRLFGAAVPITGVAGDQQAALFGQGCVRPGDIKNTYGTGCFLLMNVGGKPVTSTHRLLTTIAWVLGSGKPARSPAAGEPPSTDPRPRAQAAAPLERRGAAEVAYALEGSVFAAGAAARWLADGLGILGAADEIGPLAAQASDNGGVFFVPALAGLGAPYWDPYARGTIVGLTGGSSRIHIARATEEAIAFQTRAVFDAMVDDTGLAPCLLRVDGGAAADDFLMQVQANLLGIEVRRPRIQETSALGAAALAGIGSGTWSGEQLAGLAGRERDFRPAMAAAERDELYRLWQRAVERARGWAAP
jgi:glycerol kinase